MNATAPTYVAFDGRRRIAKGALPEVARKLKAARDARPQASLLLFSLATGEQIDLDLRGSETEVLRRLPVEAMTDDAAEAGAGELPERGGRGRPRLGVVAREVTLLPRHWDWLKEQPGGASVALRKLVEQARREGAAADRARRARDASYRFMVAMGGDLPNFEEATRALFAGDMARLEALLAPWPADIRKTVLMMADDALRSSSPGS